VVTTRGTQRRAAVVTTRGTPGRGTTRALLATLAAGAAVSSALGLYARLHVPTGRTLTTLGFTDLVHMKAWLTTAALVLAAGQVLSALRLYGRLGGRQRGSSGPRAEPAPVWVHRLHRSGGALAVLLTLPVAFQCAWSLGFGTYSLRVLVHSVLGSVLYGVFVAKMLALRVRRPPGWLIPWLGGSLVLAFVGLWLTSSLWFFTHGGRGY
jgi:hypothetical protein